MKIRPKNIPMFLSGGVPQWYLDRYGNRTSLLGWDLNKGYNYSNKNLNINDHRNAGNLDTVYRKNMAYTGTPGVVTSDIQHFYNSNGKGMTAELFVKYYNDNAAKIRGHWALDLTYNARTAGEHNPLFRQMFNSRSDLSEEASSDYNIGYQNDLEDIEGSSTWLRRMDLYENEFDINNPDTNRLHEITLSNGQKATVYKKANGDIGLFNTTEGTTVVEGDNVENLNDLKNLNDSNNLSGIPEGHQDKYGFDWSKIRNTALKILGNPNLYATARLAGQLINNNRIFNEALKGIRPDLKQTYYTHRQVVGDEATKLAYYRRAAAGETKAGRAITSDLDKLLAYQMEAKRVGDELRALGDLADNQEIRRTSDESNQHLWANTQRATEVANANIAAINQANALKLNLKALKHAAQWASIDNYLQGIEYRKRQLLAENLTLEDLIFNLQMLDDLLSDPTIIAARKEYLAVLDKHIKKDGTYDLYNDEVLEAKRKYQRILNKLTIDAYKKQLEYKRNKNNISFVKTGTKISRKKKDDLLYKSAKDTVEHFRKMSKISSDALNRKKPKIEKLAPHPKGSTRKYQLGGVAPFGVYKPVALGGETSSTTERTTSSVSSKPKKDGSDETLDMVKTLFKELAGKGLPSDVNSLYISMLNFLSRAKAFGDDISSEDIASMYLSQLLQLNSIQYLKANYDKSRELAINNNALNEFAVDFAGRLVCLSEDGNIVYAKSWNDAVEKGLNPLTNDLVSLLRASAPQLAGRSELDAVVANGVGISKIAEFLKSLLPHIGTSEQTIEGYTKRDSNDIRAGLLLLMDAPAGAYKYTNYTKSQEEQAAKAINYLMGILPPNMRAVLKNRAEMGGLSEKELIFSLIGSGMSDTTSLKFDAVTGKAAKDANGNSKEGNVGDLTPSMAFYMGMGDRNTFVILDKTTDGIKIDTNSMSLINAEGHNLGPSTLLGVKLSMFGSQLDVNSATMGDVKIAPAGLNEVLISDGMIHSTELPIDRQAASLGIIKPDFSFLKNIEKADLKLREMGITNRDNLSPEQINVINKVYSDNNLPIVYTMDGSGKPILTNDYRRFAILNGYATEKAFEGDMTFNDGAMEVDDDKTFEQFEGMMRSITKNEKYKLDRGFFGGTDLYKGTIYIPMVSSTISALGGTGYKGTAGEYMEIDRLQQQRDNALKIGYQNPIGNASILK